MSYKLFRVATCDAADCPNAVIVQGADDAAVKAGWVEIRLPDAAPAHRCPAHAGEVAVKAGGNPAS